MVQPCFYELPDSEPVALKVAPRLASWEASGHPDQIRLEQYLDYAVELMKRRSDAVAGPRAVRLDIGVTRKFDLLRERDLDNYLFPLAARVGSSEDREAVSWWATKSHQFPALLRISPAVNRSDEPGSSGTDLGVDASLITTAASESLAFKQQIHEAVASAAELPEGPVRLEISYTVGPGRNWINLWKPTIDALDPILGRTTARKDWHPRDGRITHLGLHRQVDHALGHHVRIAIRARAMRTRDIERGDQRVHLSGGPLDAVFDAIQTARPGTPIKRHIVAHPIDDDHLWTIGGQPLTQRSVQVESHPGGHPPYLIEGDDPEQRLHTSAIDEAIESIQRWL